MDMIYLRSKSLYEGCEKPPCSRVQPLTVLQLSDHIHLPLISTRGDADAAEFVYIRCNSKSCKCSTYLWTLGIRFRRRLVLLHTKQI